MVAVVETSVPVWAVDDERVDGPLGIRPARPGERLGEGELADELPAGRLVVADAAGVVGVLFGALAAGRLPTRSTRALRLFSVQAPGVPEIHVSEAFWTCIECLREGDSGVD